MAPGKVPVGPGAKEAGIEGRACRQSPTKALSLKKLLDEGQALCSCCTTSAPPFRRTVHWPLWDVSEEHRDLSLLEQAFSAAPSCSR